MRQVLPGLWLATLPGCGWLQPEQTADPLDLPLQQVDVAWRSRGAGGLAPVRDQLAPLLAANPGDGRVLWRMARVRWLDGFLATDPAEARNDWETGREYAMACLAVVPDVAAALREDGWRVTQASMVTAGPTERPCLLWGAANGLALVEARGPGGALDAEAACAMVDRASALVGPSEPGLIDWEDGTCAWWLTGDASIALPDWQKALATGNALYARVMDAHDPAADHIPPPNPDYALEDNRAAGSPGTQRH